MSEFFIELFSEEIPAGLQRNSRNVLLENFQNLFEEKKILFKKSSSFSTPNRLIILFEGLSKEITQKAEEIKGPNVNAPDKAVEGFLRSNQIDKKDLFIKKIEKGEFYFFKKPTNKTNTIDLLQEYTPLILDKLQWKKSMIWGNYNLSWARPLKSILAVFGNKSLDFKFHHLISSNTTFTDKEFEDKKKIFKTFKSYKDFFNQSGIIIDHVLRKEFILKEIDISDLTNGNNHQGAVADLNADGFLDIISLDQKENFEGRSEFFLYGSKDLTFSKAQPVPNTLAKMQYHDVEAGDVNNDGLVDLVISRVLPQTNIMSPGELIILLNTAKGIENGKILKVGKFLQDAQRWKDVLEYRQCLAEKQGFGDPYEARPGTSEITLHDYDNDGDLDIFYTQHIGGSFKNRGSIDKGSRIKLLRNEYPDFVDITETVIPDQRPLEVYTRKYGVGRPFKIFFSDVNLDDKADLILSGYSKSFHEIDNGAVSQNPYIYLFDGSKYDAVHRDDTGDLQWRSQYTPADLNGDGINDFVTVRFARKTVKHHVIDTYLAFPWLK